MKVLLININCGVQSTGRICTDLATMLMDRGDNVEIAYGRDDVPKEYRSISYRIGSQVDVICHVIISRLFDAAGKGSYFSTKKLIRHIEEYKPDIIHLHNIHGYYINIKVLFNYLKNAEIPVIWTLHDCWAFTGHCSHYSLAGCDKWKTGCHDCAQKKKYPGSLLMDRSRQNYKKKKELFNLDNLYIVTVSDWLKKQVEASFFKNKNIRVISNAIDLKIYHREADRSAVIPSGDNRKKILAVSSFWFGGKGLYDYLKLGRLLGDAYVIYMVGQEPKGVDAPDNVVFLGPINGREELIKVYSSCDVFVNFSYQETFSLVTLEAMACGLPVVVYDATAVPEVVGDKGKIIKAGDVVAAADYLRAGEYIYPERTKLEKYSIEYKRAQYLRLYQEAVGVNVDEK